MPRTTDNVSRLTREFVIEGLSRFSTKEMAEFLEQTWISSEERNDSSHGSRQATHARFSRALSMAQASCAFLASEDKKFEDLMFDPDYCKLRPYRADTYSKAEFLISKGIQGSPEGWKRIWNRASEYYIDMGQQTGTYSDTEMMIGNNAIDLMRSAAFVHGERLSDDWKKKWLEAERCGVLEKTHFRLNLALVGHYVGLSQAFTECLLDDGNKKCEIVDLLTFVRQDHTDDLNTLLVRIMRGDLPTPTECLFHPRPASTLKFTLDCIKRFMRMNRYFSHPTMILMVLNWAKISSELYTIWKKEMRFSSQDCVTIDKKFKQLERIQSMEKNRFYRVADALPPGKLRTRLFELWNRTYK